VNQFNVRRVYQQPRLFFRSLAFASAVVCQAIFPPVLFPVDGHGLERLKFRFAAPLGAIRPLESRSQPAQYARRCDVAIRALSSIWSADALGLRS